MSARKIGFLILILVFGGVVELAWNIREHRFSFGPEGLRILGGKFYGPSFEFEETEERAVSSQGPLEVEVRNSFGAVRVLPGEEGRVRVALRKVVFQPTEEKARVFAERVELRLVEQEGLLRISTNRDEVEGREKVGFETHLEVHVPAAATAVVRSDHGRVEASGIAGADVKASFEDVRVERISGMVSIDGRHGTVEASDLGADLQLKSRHGDVEVTGVEGAVDVDVEHGALTAHGTASVDARVSFGRVVVESIEGDLTLEARHAGAQIADVSGHVSVQTSYDGVRLERVGGDVTARVQHGSVKVSEVKGGVTAEASHDGVWLDTVGGPVDVSVRGGRLEARELGAEVHVEARGNDVVIEGFRGAIHVNAEGGDVHLSPVHPITRDVTVDARHGDLRLEVPAGSRFELEAESRRGALSLDVPELGGVEPTTTPTGGRATGRVGGGGARVRLTADNDLTLQPGGSALPAEKP